MTELEKIERAKMYIDKLANGINPLDDTPVSGGDVINQVRLSRCFFFVSDVLRQVLENGGVISSPRAPRIKKVPFSLLPEEMSAYRPSDKSLALSEVAKRISNLSCSENMRSLTYRNICDWLVSVGVLKPIAYAEGKQRVVPTEEGMHLGLSMEERMGQQGIYQVIVYNAAAQQFIMDNLNAIMVFIAEKNN